MPTPPLACALGGGEAPEVVLAEVSVLHSGDPAGRDGVRRGGDQDLAAVIRRFDACGRFTVGPR